jgi:hypothetical protein
LAAGAGVSRRGMILDQAAFVHLLDEVFAAYSPSGCRSIRMVSVWELLMPLMFENLYDAKKPMKNL